MRMGDKSNAVRSFPHDPSKGPTYRRATREWPDAHVSRVSRHGNHEQVRLPYPLVTRLLPGNGLASSDAMLPMSRTQRDMGHPAIAFLQSSTIIEGIGAAHRKVPSISQAF